MHARVCIYVSVCARMCVHVCLGNMLFSDIYSCLLDAWAKRTSKHFI